MARKRKADESEGGVGLADPPPTESGAGEQPATAPSPDEPSIPPAASQDRPAASFAAFSDRTTRVEVACWARPVKVSETEEYTRYTLTVSRSWRDTDGRWTPNAAYRAHDVPVLLCLVTQAYQWCVARRTRVSVETDGEVPF